MPERKVCANRGWFRTDRARGTLLARAPGVSFSRREFIKLATAGAAGAVAVTSGVDRLIPPSALAGATAPPPTPTYCEICFWKCAGWVHGHPDGSAWKVVGNERDQHSNGRLCTRGTGGIGAYLDSDRLQHPLIRTEARGKQVFRKASWDEALSYVADGMKKIAREHGPEHVALFSHGTGGGFFKTLLKAYGSANITAPSYAQCRGPVSEAFKLTFGEELGNPERLDIGNTRCLVLIGAHLGENLHNSQVQELGEVIARGDTIITVDPRFSVAASKSKHWLPIKPGTDIALLLAWMNVLITEQLYDREFVTNYALGFDELKAHVAGFTPEWAFPITSLKPEQIRATAREMAKNAPATLIHPSRHVVWYGDDTQRIRAIAILEALLGNWGKRGGLYLPNLAEVPPYPAPKPDAKPTWPKLIGSRYPFASLAPANVIRDLTLSGDGAGKGEPYFKGWLVYGSNLNQCLPQPAKTREAIQKLDLLAVVDTMPAEITGWADVVLPECTYLERYDDLRISPGRKSQVALRAPAFEPKHETKPGWWMAKQLADKLDLAEYFPWKDIEQYLDGRLKAAGSSLAALKEHGVIELKASPIYLAPGEEPRFPTPSGKVELYSQQLAEAGFDPLPKYTPHPEPPAGYYRLVYGRTPAHTFTRTANNPLLTQLKNENDLWVHPSVARRWQLKNGDYVKLANQDGITSLPIRVKVTERIRTDCVFMAHGFGGTQKQLTRAFGRGASDTQLITSSKIDPVMGGTAFRGNFVTFKQVVKSAATSTREVAHG